MKFELGPVKPYVTPAFSGNDLAPLDPNLQRRVQQPIIMGSIVVGVFVVGMAIWAALSPLDSAVVAPGTVRVEDNRKTVRHLQGGTVRAILAHEGQRVKLNQVLLRFDDVQPRASVDVLQNQYDSLLAQTARLQAEATNQRTVVFPPELLARSADPRVAGLIRDQQFLFSTRLQFFETQGDVLGQRLQQVETQIGGVQAQIDAIKESDRLTKEELAGYQTLYEKGYAPKTLILRYQRTLAELAGRRGALVADTTRLREQIGETRLQINTQRQERVSQAAEGLRQMQTGLSDVGPKLAAARQMLEASVVRSPADGYVLDLTQFTVGGIVAPGERLMSVVPADAPLIVTVRIKPQDTDIVKPGLTARVRLSAYNSQRVPPVLATVVNVSADQLTDERNGESYFRADVRIPPQELTKLPKGVKLTPGMPAEAMIVTGKRTVMSYMVSPLTDTIRDALRED
ncbi:HlyD family type I secretion periplasmic adaptor subunit [Phenylobacterium sp.]|uniref:HlyD family type I secretion periplasmic adaptor subunit n=1 Tax=Phenylobacterium sp. TaxID=1871053 RepID=UPI00286C0168|nr:HlyD family type I secretion periplasmic adaptor subunit [Phenylobacterium sp.]